MSLAGTLTKMRLFRKFKKLPFLTVAEKLVEVGLDEVQSLTVQIGLEDKVGHAKKSQ